MSEKKREFVWLQITFVSLLVIFLLVNVSSVFGLPQQDESEKEFKPGDAIRITIIEIGRSSEQGALNLSGDYKIIKKNYNEPSDLRLPLIVPVKGDGDDGSSLADKHYTCYLRLPLIDTVKVDGYDRYSLADTLRQLYSPYVKEPFITTMPLIRVTLMGAFNKPGSYRISPESSLWELIEMADGPRENCNLNSMRVERGGNVVIKNLLEKFESGHSLEDIKIRSGDQIIAKGKSSFGFREIMNYTYFIMTAISLYFSIRNYSN